MRKTRFHEIASVVSSKLWLSNAPYHRIGHILAKLLVALWQASHRITLQVSEVSSLLKYLIPEHNKWPFSFVTSSSSIKSSLMLPRQQFLIMPNSITAACQRDQSAPERKLLQYADIPDWSTHFWVIDKPLHHLSSRFLISRSPSLRLPFRRCRFHYVVHIPDRGNWGGICHCVFTFGTPRDIQKSKGSRSRNSLKETVYPKQNRTRHFIDQLKQWVGEEALIVCKGLG